MDTYLNNDSGKLTGEVVRKVTSFAELKPLISDPTLISSDKAKDIAYWVEMQKNGVKEGQNGGLFFGVSNLNSGKIGDEFIFTKGHFHEAIDTGEYYWGIKGHGLLVLHDLKNKEHVEEIQPGKILYIPGKVAHRLVNIGNDVLSVGDVWQAVSGHQYFKNNIFSTKIIADKTGWKEVRKNSTE